jgi:hypothetical protein
MPGLLLTGVGLCAALIMVAALVVIRGWRRSNGQPPAPASARGGGAGSAGNAMPLARSQSCPGSATPCRPALVPSDDPMRPGVGIVRDVALTRTG